MTGEWHDQIRASSMMNDGRMRGDDAVATVPASDVAIVVDVPAAAAAGAVRVRISVHRPLRRVKIPLPRFRIVQHPWVDAVAPS